MMLMLHAPRVISHKKQDNFGVDRGAVAEQRHARLGPSRKRRDCRLTLSPPSHDIINTFVHAGLSWHKLAQNEDMPKEDS